MIKVDEIKDTTFETLISNFDESIDYLKTQFNIELKTYGNFLRIILNNIQPDSFNNLIERVKVNRELENALSNSGGYTDDILGENNPKTRLNEIINHLRLNPLKFQQVIDFVKKNNEKKTVVADTNDIDYLTQIIRNSRIKVITLSELKKNFYQCENLVFYSFNGKKDFDFIYNLQADVSLVLYVQENNLYKSQLQKRKNLIEEEVRSNDRRSICGIAYKPIPDLPIDISQTIENIVNRIDDLGKRAYENYKEETDTLLEEIEEKIIYRTIFSNHKTEYLESNETVFTASGDLIKVYRIKNGDTVRIYPRDKLAENLYGVALETEPDVFSNVENCAKVWRTAILELKTKYNLDTLYEKLKKNGLKVRKETVEHYTINYPHKFPERKSLKAIIQLSQENNFNCVSGFTVEELYKNKSLYVSMMQTLNRGIKQEMKLYLKEKRIGEILAKLKFTAPTLQTFIDDFMPLATITTKEVYADVNGQLELNFIQQIKL